MSKDDTDGGPRAARDGSGEARQNLQPESGRFAPSRSARLEAGDDLSRYLEQERPGPDAQADTGFDAWRDEAAGFEDIELVERMANTDLRRILEEAAFHSGRNPGR